MLLEFKSVAEDPLQRDSHALLCTQLSYKIIIPVFRIFIGGYVLCNDINWTNLILVQAFHRGS